MTSWIRFTNEKLYLARLQFNLADSSRQEDTPALRESARQGGILLLHAAWTGLLNEIAESYNVKGRHIATLSDLADALAEPRASELEPLLALYEDPRSWLRILLEEYDACIRVQPAKPVKGGPQMPVRGGPQIIEARNETEAGRYQLILGDLQNYIAAFRDRIQEY